MHEGVGLGLTYVRRVADSHEAALRIFSELGKGTRVVMDFPASRIVKAVEVA
jgi:signal transduction histidine kinase